MKLGIVGLPNAGKSTLFNALTGAGAEVGAYPFTTVDPNVGVVAVPDERLERLGELLAPPKLTPPRVEFVDIAGLVEGASHGEGLGNRFLAKVREVDGIVHVVRCFDGDVAHVEGSVDPARDIGIIRTEMALADLEVVDRRREKLRAAVGRGDRDAVAAAERLDRLHALLSERGPDALIGWVCEGGSVPEEVPLLSTKPVLYVANVSEDWAAEPATAPGVAEVLAEAGDASPVVAMSARLEGELAGMPEEEEKAFREELGLEDRPVDRLIREGARLLGLITFYTVEGEETRGWMVPEGTPAGTAAGRIHTDMETGFIRAEVVPFDDLVASGGMAAARDAGRVRIEGRDAPVRDGDVMRIHFRS